MSQLGFVFLHVNCPSRSAETPTPPRTINEPTDTGIKATCPGCDQAWIVTFAEAPADLAPSPDLVVPVPSEG